MAHRMKKKKKKQIQAMPFTMSWVIIIWPDFKNI